MSTLKVLRRENTGVVYADQNDPDLTIRFRSTSANKSLNGVNVANVATEIIINDNNSVTVGGVNANDAVSVRLRTSSSLASKARVRQLLLALAAQLGAWETEGVFAGFEPVSPPVVPAS